MKNELRRIMKRKLNELSRGVYLPVGIEPSILTTETRTLFAFLSQDGEIDTIPLIEQALSRGIAVAVPRTTGNALVFHTIAADAADAADATPSSTHRPPAVHTAKIDTTQLVAGAYGIREPKIDLPIIFAPERTGLTETVPLRLPLVVLVPGLAFSRAGARLGRGKGYYDRFLRELLVRYPENRDHITLVGTCHRFQIVSNVPTEAHDIGVDCLLTGDGCILCR
ncbi:MAG: 5-formyltetrahydrofolate cyclo-ligase family protein [Spirochaetes bacterium ADurb.Bin269]|nr:MAG: 5-formyltetrahydrofolate cyclo-ligase family protein [Spirochaetes bacterium ADurb.Bin269]